jgi:hypothetical protein
MRLRLSEKREGERERRDQSNHWQRCSEAAILRIGDVRQLRERQRSARLRFDRRFAGFCPPGNLMRALRSTFFLLLLASSAACSRSAVLSTPSPATAEVDSAGVHRLLSALAADSMEGRGTGTRGGMRAATMIAAQMQAIGLTPAGDSGFMQRVPLYLAPSTRAPTGQLRPALPASWEALDTIPAARRLLGVNVVGILRGSDPVLRDEAILVDAHYDHLGIRANATGDSIFNGADDDASGTIAVLEIARMIAAGAPPKRTVVFLATTGEEQGLLGTRYYIRTPVHPLARTVANLEIEMIGRPDSLAGGRGKGWLTGYERSTMGEMLAANGIPIVPDARPSENFFMRSDNIAFARMGIPAHTLSSFNMHTDYHRPTDDMTHVDAGHMAEVIRAAVRAVRLLADGPVPVWKPGGRPTE